MKKDMLTRTIVWWRWNGFLAGWLLPGLALALSGCRLAENTARVPANVMAAVVPGQPSSPAPDPAAVQDELQRYADNFASQTSAALDEYARRVGTSEARIQALTWKLTLDSSMLAIVSGPNPTANLFDVIALATLTRSSVEDRAKEGKSPSAFEPWLQASRSLESNAFKLAEGVFTPDQEAELRTSLEQWRAGNSGASTTFFERPQTFVSTIRETGQKNSQSGSIFSLVGLDPTAGLDPAVREVTRTRLFAERAMFTFQRMPFLMRWQIELLTDQTLRQQEITNAIGSVDRLSLAAESASHTAAELPDRITTERKAILAALETQEGKLRELSAEVTRTLSAGQQMSTSLNTTLTTFDGLMKRFGVGEPSTSPPDTNSPPFNILDYARTAEQVASMAQQLDVLIKDASDTVATPALDKRIAELSVLSAKAKVDAKSVLNHAFLLVAGLILLVLACTLILRRTGRGGTAAKTP
jgi:hypothetical protein